MIQYIDLTYDIQKIRAFIGKFPDTRTLVIGDIILDEYIWGDVSRISPEAPVPVVEIQRETKSLGGAANVLHNITSLGGQSVLCGVIGDDDNGREIIRKIEGMGLLPDGIITDPARRTSIKTRVVARNQQVVRFDREDQGPLHPGITGTLLERIKSRINNLDAIIVADYGKGVISPLLMKGLRKLIADSDIILAVDPKTDHFEYYKGIDVITPNHHEAGTFCGFEIRDEERLIRAGRQMLSGLNCRSVLITQGKDGMTLFERGEEPCHIPTKARKVFDVSGAGDTVIGTLCLGLASGMGLKSSSLIANVAAGIVVGEVGTSVVTAEELIRVLDAG